MKPLWFVEKDAFGWTINCRFMLGGRKAGIGNLVTHGQYANAVDKSALLSKVIRYMDDRRESFVAADSRAFR